MFPVTSDILMLLSFCKVAGKIKGQRYKIVTFLAWSLFLLSGKTPSLLAGLPFDNRILISGVRTSESMDSFSLFLYWQYPHDFHLQFSLCAVLQVSNFKKPSGLNGLNPGCFFSSILSRTLNRIIYLGWLTHILWWMWQ